MPDPITVLDFRTELRAPIERVFAAVTEGPHLAHWLCDEARSDPQPGGRLTLIWTRPGSTPQPFEARWVVFEPTSSAAFDGGHSGYPDGYAGRVGFELASRGEGTVLVTRHRLPARPDYEPISATYRAAWPRALERLVAYLDGETPAASS
ncbi:MAG: hypothetical protein A2W00_08340 [Candidatus Eisenbacteria bacterium RBG_16_71_46]|nr:MAG: hypothetical protein A2W00_08340 [Candidatus Eisenbacteria bacterium RBG_16_71_46]